VTVNPSKKRAIRDRMAATGESYTQAARVLSTTAPDGAAIAYGALKPGRLVASVCAGGMSNTALFLPALARLRDEGHAVVVMPYRGNALPHPLDLVVLGGHSDPETLSGLDAPQITALVKIAATGFEFLDRPLRLADWQRKLDDMRARTGRAPVMFVQDIQSNGPIVESLHAPERGESELDGIPRQVSALRVLANTAEAIIAVSHCDSPTTPGTWNAVEAAADEAFLITGDYGEPLKLRINSPAASPRLIHLDTRPFRWRGASRRSSESGEAHERSA
jgi:hypothetical protein